MRERRRPLPRSPPSGGERLKNRPLGSLGPSPGAMVSEIYIRLEILFITPEG
jgi:hypothetical protein